MRAKKKTVIEFVSYDGAYPNLCSGKLIVRINGKEVSFGQTKKFWSWETDDMMADYPKFWRSGGSVSFDEDWSEEVIGGVDWEMCLSEDEMEKYYPKRIRKLLPDILAVMNENVYGGCCGGCV